MKWDALAWKSDPHLNPSSAPQIQAVLPQDSATTSLYLICEVGILGCISNSRSTQSLLKPYVYVGIHVCACV